MAYSVCICNRDEDGNCLGLHEEVGCPCELHMTDVQRSDAEPDPQLIIDGNLADCCPLNLRYPSDSLGNPNGVGGTWKLSEPHLKDLYLAWCAHYWDAAREAGWTSLLVLAKGIE